MSVDGLLLSRVYLEDELFEYFGGREDSVCVLGAGFFTKVGTYSIELALLPSVFESNVYLLQPGLGLYSPEFIW